MKKDFSHKTNDNWNSNHICKADNEQIKTPKQITCGFRTELVPYDGTYLTEENAIKAIVAYHKQYIRSCEDRVKIHKNDVNRLVAYTEYLQKLLKANSTEFKDIHFYTDNI